MLAFLNKIFLTAPDAPPMQDAEKAKSIFYSLRWRVFASITIGYAFYYIIRQSYSVIKKPLLASGAVDPTQVGIIGSIFFVTYGLGKFTNSFLADRMNNKRFFAFGLFMSSVTMAAMGLVNSFVPLAVLWGINGWFQSYGAGPSIVSLNQWFSNRMRGTLYGEKTQAQVDAEKTRSVGSMQWNAVVKNPAVWILGLSSLCVYIARYAVESWGVVYLTSAKGYDIMGAAGVMAYMQVAGIFGALLCGWISDRFFHSKRNMPALIYGLLYTASIAGFVWAPQSFYTDLFCMTFYGFTMGALVCYMGGLMAVDIVPKRVTGAAMGMIGLLSYAGAAIQEFVTGKLMTITTVVGEKIYDFGYATEFWVGAALLSTLLALLVWNAKPQDEA